MEDTPAAIAALCCHLCVEEDAAPLVPREWSALAQILRDADLTPGDLPGMTEEELCARLPLGMAMARRLVRLLARREALEAQLRAYAERGIRVVTRADAGYPRALKRSLGNGCPPLFYMAGDPALLARPAVAYVGSRQAGKDDLEFARRAVEKTVGRGYAVVSGGARGVDTAAEDRAMELGGGAVSFLAGSLLLRLEQPGARKAVEQGALVLLSAVKPDGGFSAGVAMMRNRYIYAQSVAAVVVRSDDRKGGTWAGATDALAHRRCPVFCRVLPDSRGNAALLSRGALPIDENWDGDLTAALTLAREQRVEQLSLI